jgi:hypothetical protein
LDATKISAGISVGIQQMEAHGWDVDLCLVKPDETAPVTLERRLTTSAYDCVVLGGGICIPPKSLLLFETLINAAHKCAPNAFIAFNTRPEDTAEAAARWLDDKKPKSRLWRGRSFSKLSSRRDEQRCAN